jgi:LacI family transcriptional regulator
VPQQSSRPVTIRAVAERAGVHISTASRALDARTAGLVNEATVARVLRAAKELHYTPNAAARALRRGRTSTLGVVVPDLTNPQVPLIIRGLSTAVSSQGYVPVIVETLDRDGELESAIGALLSRQVDSLVVLSAHLDDDDLIDWTRQQVPTVLAMRTVAHPRVHAVINDDAAGAASALRHLASLGHTEVLELSGSPEVSPFARRAAAVQAEAVRLGIRTRSIVTRLPPTVELGRNLAREAFAHASEAPTAIFAHNDLLAVGAIEHLKSLGLRCPDDVSVIGFNDAVLPETLDPPLTTVRLSSTLLGSLAGDIALRLISEPDLEPFDQVLPTQLVVRSSTAPPPSDMARA